MLIEAVHVHDGYPRLELTPLPNFPSQLRLPAGQEHGRTVPLAGIALPERNKVYPLANANLDQAAV
jgi:hypothetical protein